MNKNPADRTKLGEFTGLVMADGHWRETEPSELRSGPPDWGRAPPSEDHTVNIMTLLEQRPPRHRGAPHPAAEAVIASARLISGGRTSGQV